MPAHEDGSLSLGKGLVGLLFRKACCCGAVGHLGSHCSHAFLPMPRRGSQKELGRALAAKHHSLKYLLLDALSNGLSQALSTASSNLTAGAESAVLQGRNVVLWALGEVLPCIETPRVLFVVSASIGTFSARQTGLKLQPYMPMTAVMMHTHLDIC